jgi:hypothetical protein
MPSYLVGLSSLYRARAANDLPVPGLAEREVISQCPSFPFPTLLPCCVRLDPPHHTTPPFNPLCNQSFFLHHHRRRPFPFPFVVIESLQTLHLPFGIHSFKSLLRQKEDRYTRSINCLEIRTPSTIFHRLASFLCRRHRVYNNRTRFL